MRIDLDEHDRRIFTPTPWGNPSWKRGYRRRSALERINDRIDHGSEFEQHFMRGSARMRTRVGVALAVMMALALGHVRAGRPESMRSLFAAVPFADTGCTPRRSTHPPRWTRRRARGPLACAPRRSCPEPLRPRQTPFGACEFPRQAPKYPFGRLQPPDAPWPAPAAPSKLPHSAHGTKSPWLAPRAVSHYSPSSMSGVRRLPRPR